MKPALDYLTLYVCGAVSAFAVTVIMYYVWRTHRRESAVRYWFLGYLTWAMSLLLTGFAPQLPVAFRLVTNTLGVGCITLLYLGTARFLGKPVQTRRLAAVYVPAAVGLVGWTLVDDSTSNRLLVYMGCVVFTAGLIVRDLLSAGSGPVRSAHRFLAANWIVVIVVFGLRIGYVLGPGRDSSAAANGAIQMSWFALTMIVDLMTCGGYLLMVSQRLQEKNNWARIEELFHETLRLPAGKRAAHLKDVCEGDAVLFSELESLIRAAEAESTVAPRIPVGAGLAAALPTWLAPGTRLGEYEIERFLGAGGMGEVYLAATAETRTPVAIKLLRREASAHSDLFEAESRVVAGLDHPGITRIVGSGVAADSRPYMAMEYVAGESITEHVRCWRLPLKQRLLLFRDVCHAVEHAHARSVIHRDLKPGNVLVTATGEVKLLDFGVAKTANPLSLGAENATQTRVVPFTAEYAAPEQLQGRSVTAAADIYALGVLLFELLTDERPWNFGALPPYVAMHKVLHEAAPRPSEVAAASPAPPVLPRLLRGGLDALVDRCLRKNPRDRYPSVAALRSDVDRCLQGGSPSISPRDGWRRWLPRAGSIPTGAPWLAGVLVVGVCAGFWLARALRL